VKSKRKPQISSLKINIQKVSKFMSEIITKEFENFSIRTLFENEIWFIAKDVAIALEYPPSSIKTINKLVQKVPEKWRGRKPISTLGGLQKLSVLSKQGVLVFVAQSIKATPEIKEKLLNFLGIKKEYLVYIKEIEFGKELENFIKTIYNLEVKTQYPVKNYKLDFYIPKFNLAIEFDEKHHKYQKEEDKKRENEIKDILNCKFVRVSEEQSIGEQLGLVIKTINEKPKKEISLSKRQKQILEYLQNHKLSTKELSKKLGFSKSTILKDLKFLIENEQI
jgi:very-short-patch-repair endonuclease